MKLKFVDGDIIGPTPDNVQREIQQAYDFVAPLLHLDSVDGTVELKLDLLPPGAVLGRRKSDPSVYRIEIGMIGLSGSTEAFTKLAHQLAHVYQFVSGRMSVNDQDHVIWDGQDYGLEAEAAKSGNRPWEDDAREQAEMVVMALANHASINRGEGSILN